jgi:hypothetical protein
MILALQIQYRTVKGAYAAVTLPVEPAGMSDYAATIKTWSLENLPEGSQILGAVVGWTPRPSAEMVERRLERLVRSQASEELQKGAL